MSRCYDCRDTIGKGEFRCDDCAKMAEDNFKEKTSRKRGLTDYEVMKLDWYKNEKEWHRNIESRQLLKGRDGKVTTTYKTKSGNIREMPEQPKKYWKPPKGGEV